MYIANILYDLLGTEFNRPALWRVKSTPHLLVHSTFLSNRRCKTRSNTLKSGISFTLRAPLPPEAFRPAADLSGALSPRLTSLCSGSIVLPASGMLTSTVLEKSARTDIQTHIYGCTSWWARTRSLICSPRWWLAAIFKCKSCHMRTIYTSSTASSFVSVVYSPPGNHVLQTGLFFWLMRSRHSSDQTTASHLFYDRCHPLYWHKTVKVDIQLVR